MPLWYLKYFPVCHLFYRRVLTFLTWWNDVNVCIYVSLSFLWLAVADLYNKKDNNTDTSNPSFSTIYYYMYQTRTYISISFSWCIFCVWKFVGEVVVSFGWLNGRSFMLKFSFSNIYLIKRLSFSWNSLESITEISPWLISFWLTCCAYHRSCTVL